MNKIDLLTIPKKKNEVNIELKDVISYKDADNKWQKEVVELTEDDKYLYYISDYIKEPKISSHTLVDLTGSNKYTSIGKTILTMFGLTARGSMDQYQVYKGGIAEVFAEKYLREYFENDIVLEAFEVKQFDNFNQFPEAAPFSGVLDLMMHHPRKMTIEVKSKEMKDYEKIADHGMFPKDQVLQGANQAILANTEDYLMVWVFLEPHVSKLLKSIAAEKYIDEKGVETDLWIWKDDYAQAVEDLELTMNDFKFFVKEFHADERLIKAYREKALELYNDFYIERRIAKKLFGKGELAEIKRQYAEKKK